MSDQFLKDQLFSKLMKNSKLEMPFSDFEERTMARIKQENDAKSSLSIYKKLAVLFFIIGTGFGFLITYFLSLSITSVLGVSSDTLLLLCRTIYVLIVITQLDSIIGLFSASSEHHFIFNTKKKQ